MSIRIRDEAGSLPMVLLAAIVLGGLIVALYGQVRSGQETARRDRDYQGAIQVADAGVQAAFTELAAVDPDDPTLPALDDFYGLVTGQAGEGTFEWQARRTARSLWEVRSAGTYRGETRYVEALIGEQPIFPFALFGESLLDIQKGGGSNTIDSLTDTIARLGTNGVAALQSQLLDLIPDGLILECFGDDAAENCPDEAVTHRMEVPFQDLATQAYAPGGDCADEDGAPMDDGIFNGTWGGASTYEENPLVRGEVYCFSQVIFDAPSGSGLNAYPVAANEDPDLDQEPVRIYIDPAGDTQPAGGGSGGDNVGVHVPGTGSNFSEVNWEASGTEDPDMLTSRASDLLIFVPGTRTVRFDNNSSRVAAGIYAPLSTCDLRAQGEVVGSLICGTIDGSGGGWALTYDDRLADYSLEDVYSVLNWSEQTPGVSTFDWG